MPSQRDDYIHRLIDQLRQFVAQIVKFRASDRLDEALLAIVNAQEKLFARPAPEFISLTIPEQLALLTQHESEETGRTKCLAYASILKEAGLVYEAKGQGDFAQSAFQLALYVNLQVAKDAGETTEEQAGAIAFLMARVPSEELHAPVKDLLQELGSRKGANL
ncbi:MAG TPA: hypothetical protein VKC60_09500 [Opitutaceae bacterium]|nr:hypothetical protein [Opitutaceae bacterium]